MGRTGAPHIPSPPGPGGHGPAPAFGQTPWDLVVGLAGHLGLDWEAAAAPRSPPEPLGTRAWLKTQAAGIGPVPQPDTPPPPPRGWRGCVGAAAPGASVYSRLCVGESCLVTAAPFLGPLPGAALRAGCCLSFPPGSSEDPLDAHLGEVVHT